MLQLEIVPGRLAICRLDPTAAIPDWALKGAFSSITRTPEELSIVCAEDAAPLNVLATRGWRGLRVAGTLDFALTGVLAGLAQPLAEAGVSIFAISTYDTDYLLVEHSNLERAVAVLKHAGYQVQA